MKQKTVCILGGGIAGLSAGWRLAEAGFDVYVFEREKKVGGLSKTTKYKKFLFDYSAHRFNSDNPEIVKKFKYLIGKEYLTKPKKLSLIYHWGQHITYPPRASELIRVMPPPYYLPVHWSSLVLLQQRVCLSNRPESHFPTGHDQDLA